MNFFNRKILIAAVLYNVLFLSGIYFWKKNDISKKMEAASLMGKTLQYEGIDFSESNKTVVLYMTTTCSHCKAMMPFYKELSETSIPIVVVTPNTKENMTAYLKDIKTKLVIGDKKKEVLGYPALAIVDETGKVIYWRLGRLTAEDQEELMDGRDLISAIHVNGLN